LRALSSSSVFGVYISQQCVQSLRARRCARTAETAAPVRNGSTPISLRRVSACGASFVCSVESTRWPVRAASIAILAVSPSRISPTITTSGSERRIERSAVANVSPARWLICTWLTPASRYSTGSSTVMMLISGRLSCVRAAQNLDIKVGAEIRAIERVEEEQQEEGDDLEVDDGVSDAPLVRLVNT